LHEVDAAQYYPAIYWYAMLKIPEQSQFGGKSNIPEKLTQIDWLKQVKNIGCIGCHPLGQLSTRTLPPGLGEFKSHEEAWMRRIAAGQAIVRDCLRLNHPGPYQIQAAINAVP